MKLCLGFCFLTAMSGWIKADPIELPLRVSPDSNTVSNRYCGLYCVYQAGRMSGKTIPLNDLFRADRLQGDYGSTMDNLAQACSDHGIRHFTNLHFHYLDLCLLSQPAIILIKSHPEAKEPNHWIMILDAKPGRARIFEPSVGVIDVPEAELQVLWDGPALVVLNTDSELEVRAAWIIAKIVLGLSVMAAILLSLRLLILWTSRPIFNILLVSAGLAAILHLLHPVGFLQNGDWITSRARTLDPAEPSFIDPAMIVSHENDYSIIDVRTRQQYEYQHLPGALHIGIDAPYWRNQAALAKLPKDARLVLYCNSSDCRWAEHMARSSLYHRFSSVTVLQGGRDDYIRAGGKPIGAAP